MHPMINSCCADLLVNVSAEYPELVGYEGLYHTRINETTGRGGKVKLIFVLEHLFEQFIGKNHQFKMLLKL